MIVLATTFRRVGEPQVAASLLATTSGPDVRPLIVGAWEHAWAEVQLALGDLDAAHTHARLAAATRYAAIGPGSPAHTATRALLGRILLAAGELDEAEEVLFGALSELRGSALHDRVIEAEVEAAASALLTRRGRTGDGRAAARRALALVGSADDDPYASTLPVRRALLSLLPAEAEPIRQDISTIEASYRGVDLITRER
ncbi:MAG: tetratricopeptide repeat protein [Deltaproteobacteria bacterium]|nr:tetratricopeptide repeat protein [Deltaproteobacteria bacterium]